MFQNVLTNNKYKQKDVCLLYINKLNNLADKVVNKEKFGIDNKIDRLNFIKIKNLLPIINNVDDEYVKCCLKSCDKVVLFNKLVSSVN